MNSKLREITLRSMRLNTQLRSLLWDCRQHVPDAEKKMIDVLAPAEPERWITCEECDGQYELFTMGEVVESRVICPYCGAGV